MHDLFFNMLFFISEIVFYGDIYVHSSILMVKDDLFREIPFSREMSFSN